MTRLMGSEMMTVFPVELRMIDDTTLAMTWSDGQNRRYTARELRNRCPCAACRTESTREGQTAMLLPVLSPAETHTLRILKMRPVGNYAYAIAFSDGHNTGIYTFDLLRELGKAEP